MTQAQLASALGLKQTQIANIENGVSMISLKTMMAACTFFDLPLNHFVKFIDPTSTVPPPPAQLAPAPPSVATFQVHPVDIPQQPPIPILGSVGAGPALDDPIYGEVLDFAKLFAGDLAAYTVIGDSMREAHILDGDTIICRRTPVPLPGEEVVAWLDDHNGCVIKTLQGGRATLGWLTSDDGWRHDLTTKDVVYGALISVIRSKRNPTPKKKPKRKK